MHTSREPRRVALVTGAAQGIGAAVALRLARDGCAVAVLDLDEQACAGTVDAISAGGGSAVAVTADVAHESAVTGAVELVATRLGPPRVLVNNAGFARVADLVDMTTKDWDAVLGVSLRGAFLATRAVARHMIAAGWGRVVNVSSISAFGDAGRVGYATAKAGLVGFTRTLATELGPHGITVNAVSPGFIVSAMTAASAQRLGRSFAEHQRIAAAAIAVGRVGQPEDIAHAVSFFASEQAGFVTGQILTVAGGPAG